MIRQFINRYKRLRTEHFEKAFAAQARRGQSLGANA